MYEIQLPLTKGEKIETLELMHKSIRTGRASFICIAMDIVMLTKYKTTTNISSVIPEFTFDKCVEICKRKHVKMPVRRYAFWDSNNKKSRLTVLRTLINELKQS